MSCAGSETARSTPLRSVIVPRGAGHRFVGQLLVAGGLAQRRAAQRRRDTPCARRPAPAAGRTARRSRRCGAGRPPPATPRARLRCRPPASPRSREAGAVRRAPSAAGAARRRRAPALAAPSLASVVLDGAGACARRPRSPGASLAARRLRREAASLRGVGARCRRSPRLRCSRGASRQLARRRCVLAQRGALSAAAARATSAPGRVG